MYGKSVITEEGQEINYSDLIRLINNFANQFNEKSTVIIVTTNTVGSLVGYLGCLYGKHVPFMLDKNVDYDDVNSYILNYKINYIWIPDGWMREKSRGEFVSYPLVLHMFNYSLICLSNEIVELNDELALLLTTSGSTGSNKLVRISKKNLESNTKAIAKYMNIKSTDCAITSLPMNYTYGLSVINTHLFMKSTILLTEKNVTDREFWEFFKKNNGTFFAGVPYTYELIKRFGIMSGNIKTLKTFTVAGGKIGADEEKYFTDYAIKYDKKFTVMYGQTEATARISYRPTESNISKLGSAGIVIPEGRMWIEDKNGNVINKPKIRGEIVYSGENVAMGYAYNYKDLSKGYEWKNVLHTGDTGYMDEDGYLYILGRNDRNVKINGCRIDLDDVEKKINAKNLGYTIKCEVEKCMSSYITKRIKVDVLSSGMWINEDNAKREIEKEILINTKLLNITFLNGTKKDKG